MLRKNPRPKLGRVAVLGLALLVRVAGWAQASYWEVDPVFAPVLEGNTGTGGVVLAHAYPGGKLLVATSYSIINGKATTGWLTRMNPDGTIDETFAVSGGGGRLLAVYPDGRILYGFVPTSGVSTLQVKRMLPDGSDDPAFSPVPVGYDFISAVLLDDGRIYLSGPFATVGGVSRPNLVRLNPDGSVDETFTSPFSAGNVSGVSLNTVIPTADGQHIIVAGGGLGLGMGRGNVARLNQDGSVDAAFSLGAFNFSWSTSRAFPQPDGKVVVADGVGDLVRFTSTGAEDSSFVPALVGDTTSFSPPGSDGKIYYTTMTVGAMGSIVQLRRMLPNFTDDTSFQVIATPYASSYQVGLPVVMDNGALCLGSLTAEREQAKLALSIVLADGNADPGFNPRFSRPANVAAHLRQPDGKQLVAGQFLYVNNTAMPGGLVMVRLLGDGTMDSGFSATFPTGSSVSRLGLQPDGRILAFGSFPLGGENYASVIRFNSDGSWDPAFTAIPTLGNPATDAAGRIYGVTSEGLRRFLAAGQVDHSFQAPDSTTSAKFIEPMPDGRVLVARLVSLRNYSVLRLLPDGAQDPAFAPRGIADLIAFIGLPDGSALVATRHNAIPHGAYLVLRRLSPDGTFDFQYTTRQWSGTVAGSDIQLSVAGVLLDLVDQASPGVVSSVYADFSDFSLRMTLDCRSDGQLMRVDTPSALGTLFPRYRRTSADKPSFNATPFIAQFYAVNPNLRPLNSLFQPQVVAGGLAPFTYQWWHDGSLVAGADQEFLRLFPLQASDAGDYHVVVTNPHGTASSTSFQLTIDTEHSNPVIVTHPVSRVVNAGGSATFTVEATANPPPNYQWRRNGNVISNATGTSLVMDNIQAVDAGSYTVIVNNTVVNASGSFGSSISSQVATLTLSQSLVFESLADRAFSTTPMSLIATASSGLAVNFSVVSGPATISGNQLTLTGPGTVTVRASQAGDATYAAATPVDRSFVVTGNYSSWLSGKFSAGELADPGISGPNADPDGDGYSNLVEYALGLEPKAPSTTDLPEMSTTSTDWIYTYSRPDDRTELTYTVEVSTDLASWSTGGVTLEQVSSSGGVDIWRARYPLASAGCVFFRIKISQ